MNIDIGNIDQIMRLRLLVLATPCSGSAFDQVTTRMQQEAFIDNSRTVRLKHLFAALVGVPNGPARFELMEILRTNKLTDKTIRENLGLGDYDFTVTVNEQIPLSHEVETVLLRSEEISIQRRKDDSHAVTTKDLLHAMLEQFKDDNHKFKEQWEFRLVQAISSGQLR